MQDANYILGLARWCHALEETANEPELVEQLRVWAAELAEIANDVERRAAQYEAVP